MKESQVSRGQMAVLVGLICLFFAIIAAAPMLKGNLIGNTDRKLRAKPGTEREGARALVSDRASSTPADQLHGTRDEPLEGWDAPKNFDRLKEMASDENDDDTAIVVDVANAEKSMIALQTQLAAAPDVDTTLRLYVALGKLYAFRDPPDAAAAEHVFAEAASIAPTAQARHQIARERIAALHGEAAPERVVALVDEAVLPDDDVSLATLELKLMKAAALENLDRREEAVLVYREVMDQALAARDENALHAEDVYRQSAMRLARAYRESEQPEEAEAVTREVRRLRESER